MTDDIYDNQPFYFKGNNYQHHMIATDVEGGSGLGGKIEDLVWLKGVTTWPPSADKRSKLHSTLKNLFQDEKIEEFKDYVNLKETDALTAHDLTWRKSYGIGHSYKIEFGLNRTVAFSVGAEDLLVMDKEPHQLATPFERFQYSKVGTKQLLEILQWADSDDVGIAANWITTKSTSKGAKNFRARQGIYDIRRMTDKQMRTKMHLPEHISKEMIQKVRRGFTSGQVGYVPDVKEKLQDMVDKAESDYNKNIIPKLRKTLL